MTIDGQMIEVANGLISEFGNNHIVTIKDIVQIFDKQYNRPEGSVIPSDYCYNRINKGIQLNKPAVFEYLGGGKYGCLGLNYPYNGPIYHKPKGQPEIIVGKCINGNRVIAPDNSYDNQSDNFVITDNEQIKHKTKRDPSMSLRFEILKRDNFKCCTCGASPAKDVSVELHIDHIIPWSKGGETTAENLQTLCSKCNIGKRDLL